MKAFTKEQFISKISKLLLKNLDLSHANYHNNKTKVIVSCKIHPEAGTFNVLPYALYAGNNPCPDCRNVVNSQESFIRKAKRLGHPYLDLSEAVYYKNTPVKLSCIIHKEQFEMTPQLIYNGVTKCVQCGGQVYTHEQFMTRARLIAAKNLSLDKAIYQSAHTKVEVHCKNCPKQVFWMLPITIYSGINGCPGCNLTNSNAKKSHRHMVYEKRFFDKCAKLACHTFDLSSVKYQGTQNKVSVKCKIHPEVGEIQLTVYALHSGINYCPKCNPNDNPFRNPLTQQEFLDKCAKRVNPNVDISESQYNGCRTKIIVKCKIHPEVGNLETTPDCLYKGHSPCKKCSNSGTSQKEQDLADFIKSIYKGNIVLNDRSVLEGKELDIYLPDKQLAIEFNGVYWHSSAIKSPKYHYKKYKECQSKGIRLIQIWEDTWDSRKETVKHFLRQELNTLPTESLKNTAITTDLDEKTVKAFLNKYHLEGFKQYDYTIGLKHQSTKELLSVMTFTKTANKGELLLSRFATKTAIVGSFNALIDTAKENCVKGLYRAKNSSKVRCFIAYTNNETDTGELYKNNGWQKVTDVPITYTYREKNSHRQKMDKLSTAYKCYDSGWQQWQIQII